MTRTSHRSHVRGRRETVKTHLQRLKDDDRGFSLIFMGVGFMTFLSASMLAIDVGMLMTARGQAQNAADAGAHAGATALVFNSFSDHSASGPAVVGAMTTAQKNLVMGEAPSVIPSDVTFPMNPDTGQSDLVQVKVYRTQARGNPLETVIARIFGIPTADVSATATAVAAPADVETCVMPLTVPDKWIEKQCASPPCAWAPTNRFDLYDAIGNPLANPDVYIPPGQSGTTGYNPHTDKGLELVLKSNNESKVAPSMYNPWDLPGSVGGSDYRDNIINCNPNIVKIGDDMTPENGNMTGPTKQGTDGLIAKDPNAYWDTACKCVKGSAFATSPRIRIVPLYNPVLYAQGKQSGKSQPHLQVVNYLGFFIERITGGGEVTGRITPILGRISGKGAASTGAFARAIMLVQ
jgi:Flp pilus assembly protein TadG